jgi:hypothetical protein
MTSSKTPLLLPMICAGLSSILVVACSDRHESFYPALADAGKDGAITRGWIPDDLLPDSSHAIREIHDLSPSKEWCSFEFTPAKWQSPSKAFKTVDALPPQLTHIPSPGTSWWPDVLRGHIYMDKIRKEGLKIYVVERPATSVTTEVFLFAINHAKGQGFFFSTNKGSSPD